MIWWCIYCIYTTRKKKKSYIQGKFQKRGSMSQQICCNCTHLHFFIGHMWVNCNMRWKMRPYPSLLGGHKPVTDPFKMFSAAGILCERLGSDGPKSASSQCLFQGAAAANVSREVKPANKLTTRHRSSSEPLQVSVSCTPLQIKHLSRFLHTQNKGIENISPACGLIWTEAVVNTYLYN